MLIKSPRLALASFAVIALLLSAHASAATIKWNSATSGNWNTAANWSPAQVPGASDIAVINFPGTYSVTLDVNTTVLGLCIGGSSGTQTLAISSNTLTLNGPSLVDSNGRIAQSGSTFDITTFQNTFLENKGTIDWSGGTISTGFIENRGAFNILPSATAKVLASSLQITNDGTITWSGDTAGGGDFDMRNDSNILSAGQFNITGNATVTTTTPGFEGVITVNGTMKKLVGSLMTTVDKILFDVNGVLEVDTGTLYFTTKINPILPGGTTLLHGTYIVKSELRLNSANIGTFNNGANVTLDGAGAVINNQTPANALAGLAQLDGGSSLTLKNGASLSCAGALNNDGKVAIFSSSTLNLSTSPYSQTSSAATVLNSGTIIASSFTNGGFISGNGTLQGAVTNTGLISPGSAPSNLGTIAITGALSNTAGTVAVKVKSMSQFDSLSVGASTLNGTLNVTLVNGYKPGNGDTITVVTGAPTTSGSFPTTTLAGAALVSLSQGISSNNLQLTFNAASQALWLGTTSTSWNTTANWSTSLVPTSADNVHIPATAPNFPVLVGPSVCRDLLIDGGTGTHLDMATFNLTVNGNLQTSSAIASTGGGNLILAGVENNSLESLGANGSICRTSITAAYTVANNANTVFNGPVTVSGGTARLILNNAKVTVNGDYAQTGSGLLIMQNSADGLTIVGNASFGGGNQTGLLTAGLLEIQGSLTTGAPAHSFDATAPHTTRFTGASSVSNPTFNQFYGNLEIGTGSTSANLQFNADSHVTGDVFLTKGIVTTSSGTVTATIDGNLFDPPGGNWQAANTVFTSQTPTLPPTILSNVMFAPSGAGTAVLPLGFTITGTNNLTVVSGMLDLNGNLVVVGNDFLTTGTGSLQSFNQAGELSVLHDVKFSGGDEKGQLLAGRIRVKHDFLTLDNGEGAAFNADLVHVVTLDGTTPQTVNFFVATEAFQNLEINGASTSVTLTSDATVTGGVKLLNGSFTLAGGKTLTINSDGYGQAAGSLVLNSSSQISSTAPVSIFGGTVGGIGSINAAVNNTGGTITPGLSGSTNEGTLSMTSYVQGAGGSLNVRVNAPGTFDQLSASSANLAGTLNIAVDGYVPNVIDVFHIVAGSVSGTFTTVNGTNINAAYAFSTQYTIGNVQLLVLQKPQITNPTLTATAQVGQAFSGYSVLTSGSPTIVVSSSPLPSGLTLNSGMITGTPAAGTEGVSNITLTATNTAGFDTKTLVLTINRIPAFTSAATATSTVNQPVSITLAATGFPTPVFAALSALPAGLMLSGNTLSGTPTTAGVTTISLQASNSVGADTQSFQFTSTTSGPPVIVSLASSLNPSQTGSSVTFTAVATHPDGAALTFTWDFQDGSATATGNPVQHIFTIENTFGVICTVSDGVNSVQSTLSQQVLAPSSGGGGVPNITQGTTPVVDPLSGLTIDVTNSDGGVLTFTIDVNSLTRDAFSVSTDFQSIGGRSDAVTGTTVVHKFTDPGVYVATSTATETATQTLKGKARKTVAISSLETGTPPKFTKKPLKTVIGVTAIKGNFLFNRNSDGSTPQVLADSVAVARAASAKPDVVTMTGSIELPEGLDLSQTQDFSFGIGNIIDQVSVTSKGKAVLPSALKRIKALSIKYPKLAKGSTLTTAGQIAKFTISYSQAGLSAAGFDADGITGTLKSGETAKSTLSRTIQVAMTFAGQTWEVQAPVQFKVSAKGDSGSISGRSGGQ